MAVGVPTRPAKATTAPPRREVPEVVPRARCFPVLVAVLRSDRCFPWPLRASDSAQFLSFDRRPVRRPLHLADAPRHRRLICVRRRLWPRSHLMLLISNISGTTLLHAR